jgi:XTP/dITP diphosphohydrolase
MLLYACSTNPGKLSDFALAAKESNLPNLTVLSLPEMANIAAPEETGATFEENAALKALYYSQYTQDTVFADDSGLEVDSLGGEPGIFSARLAGPGATDSQNNQLLLDRLRPLLNRHARFVCALAAAQAGRLLTVVQGSVEGEILEQPRGANGFGYDPLFFYPPLGKSFGELSREVKFSVSHRGHAIRALLRSIEEMLASE